MTLILRIRTPNRAIHFSDGRKTNNGTVVTDHAKKIVSKPEFLISLSGILDIAQGQPTFDIYNRLNTQLAFNPDYLAFRQDIFNQVAHEYAKDTVGGNKDCTMLVSYKAPDSPMIYETLHVFHKKSHCILMLKNAVMPATVINDMVDDYDYNILSVNFRVRHLQLDDMFMPDFEMDFNHLYDSQTQMTQTQKNLIYAMMIASYFDIKGNLPTAQGWEQATPVELLDIGTRFYDKFNATIPHFTIGNYEDVFTLP